MRKLTCRGVLRYTGGTTSSIKSTRSAKERCRTSLMPLKRVAATLPVAICKSSELKLKEEVRRVRGSIKPANDH